MIRWLMVSMVYMGVVLPSLAGELEWNYDQEEEYFHNFISRYKWSEGEGLPFAGFVPEFYGRDIQEFIQFFRGSNRIILIVTPISGESGNPAVEAIVESDDYCLGFVGTPVIRLTKVYLDCNFPKPLGEQRLAETAFLRAIDDGGLSWIYYLESGQENRRYVVDPGRAFQFDYSESQYLTIRSYLNMIRDLARR